jgi:hypothetical protein
MTHPTPRRRRPAKFGRPAQAVTITLPDDIVAAFRSLDPDLSRAIVHLAEFEVRVRDTLAAGTSSPGDRTALEALGEILREARRSRSAVSKPAAAGKPCRRRT